jgi:hypothetical protein
MEAIHRLEREQKRAAAAAQAPQHVDDQEDDDEDDDTNVIVDCRNHKVQIQAGGTESIVNICTQTDFDDPQEDRMGRCSKERFATARVSGKNVLVSCL